MPETLEVERKKLDDGAGALDSVEVALSKALELAAQAGEWATVGELARQLEARRRARVAPEVTELDLVRKRKDGDR